MVSEFEAVLAVCLKKKSWVFFGFLDHDEDFEIFVNWVLSQKSRD